MAFYGTTTATATLMMLMMITIIRPKYMPKNITVTMSIHEKDSAADSEATMSCFYNKKTK